MKLEESYLLALCRAGFTGTEPPALPEGLTWEALMALAESHHVYALAADAMLRLPTAGEAGTKLALRYQAMARFYESQQTAELDMLVAYFTAAKVDYCLLKGSRWKLLYRDPTLRSMCDIDVLVRLRDWEKACRVLTAMGYTADDDIDLHMAFSKDGMRIELHRDLLSNRDCTVPQLGYPWEIMTRADGCEWRLPETEEYLYFITHAERHVGSYTFSLRMLADTAVLTDRLTVDRPRFLEMAESIGLRGFAENLETLAEAWRTGRARTRAEEELLTFLMEANRLTKDERWYRDNGRWLRMNLTPRRMSGQFFLPEKVLASHYAEQPQGVAFRRHFMRSLRYYGRSVRSFFKTRAALSPARRRELKRGHKLVYTSLRDAAP